MIVAEETKALSLSFSEGKKEGVFCPPRRNFSYFWSTKAQNPGWGILRRKGLYSTDLARIRNQVRAGTLERLSARPGPKRSTVVKENYEALKRELKDKERALAELAVELAILRKKRMGLVVELKQLHNTQGALVTLIMH